MMFKRVLLLFALMAALLVAPVVAYDNETEIYEEFNGFETFKSHDTHYKTSGVSLTRLSVSNIENYVSIHTVFYRPFDNAEKWVEVADSTKISGIEPVTLRYGSTSGPIIAVGSVSYYHGETPETSHVRLDLDTWYGDVVGDDTGGKSLYIELPANTNLRAIGSKGGASSPNRLLCFGSTEMAAGHYQVHYTTNFRHKLTLTEESSEEYRLTYTREFGKKHDSIVTIIDRYGIEIGSYHDSVTEYKTLDKSLSPFLVNVESTEFGTVYRSYLGPGNFTFDPDELSDPPEDPGIQPIYRKGSVTMTDNNGTTISGFAVTAINAYTDEIFTVSTHTDVAVITLPMDRTIEIRNPQTGEYEEAPVGYYRFYGQSPGYKMLYEDGIQVSVMPEKYGSYQLCDIRVTQESGYLTGKHQFQIRSRSDNSILQTGTISAKSATTDEWYNTSVTNGIASLILPYDTSNVISQYAGNYYVYATSPGYEDSDYGTQIVVMPHTVSEIHSIQLTPIGGVPTPGNVTLRIQVFSETGQGIPNAEIFIAGVLGAGADVWDTYTASSTGYLTVSVPGNSTYDIVASGTGYYDSARRVQVFDDDPGLIEIKLYLSGAPTVPPTTQPTGWVTPTPTQTSPIQEDNIIGLSVKGLAKGFGIDYDTALLMFGLMIIFGAGGMVMSSVKGGAMEFIAGSIVGTFVAFALGLIPIWIFIIIAVVFGAYVLRVFVQGSQ